VVGRSRVVGSKSGADDSRPGVRRLPRRSSLPSGRAIAGGLLVALSGLGLYSAHETAAAPPATRYVIAVREIRAGDRVTGADVAFAPLDLVDELSRSAVGDPDAVIGRVALAPIAAFSLLHRDQVGAAPPREDGPSRRVTLELEASRALDGQVRSGDVVDVVATGTEAGSTQVIIDGALVETVGRSDEARIGSDGRVRLTVVVADEEAATALIDAAEHRKVTLVMASPIRMGAS
jgi:hypothetical protein